MSFITRHEYDGGHAVARAVSDALAGERVYNTRVEGTHEQLDYRLVLPSSCYMLANTARPDMSTAIAIAEGLHLIAGTHHGAAMAALTAGIDSVRWTSDAAAPAEVLYDQMPEIIGELMASPASRRGYATLWERGDLLDRADQACATGLLFMIREERLRLTVTMRSNDVWHGLPYNLFAFGLLQTTVASCLGVRPGAYTHQVGSLHLYDRHLEKAARVRTPMGVKSIYTGPIGKALPGPDAWPEACGRAQALLQGVAPYRITPTEEWCLRAIVTAAG